MLGIDFEIDAKALARLDALPGKIRPALKKAMRQAMFYAEMQAKTGMGGEGRPKVRTGTLRRSITSGVEEDNNEIVGWVGVKKLIYATILELGGIIRPKNKKYLRFQIGDQWVTTKKVTIPPYAYLRPAVEENLNTIKDILIDNIIRDMER